MHSIVRRMVALLAASAILAIAAPTAGAASGLHVEEHRTSLRAATNGLDAPALAARNPCQDTAYSLLGVSQAGSYAWSFHAASTPSYLGQSAVREVLVKSFSNMTNASNDCGLADNVSATHTYQGVTSTKAKCGQRDSQNVIGFRRLGPGVLAVTCYWTRQGRIIEADMQINTRVSWALSMASCSNDEMLEATITHEAGHVFGLGHVNERRHGRLTMSTASDGACDNGESSLGLGDVRGMEALY